MTQHSQPQIPLLQSSILRIVMGSGLLAIALLIGNTLWSYQYEQYQIVNELRNNTYAIAINAAPNLDIRSLNNPSSTSKESIQRLNQQLRIVQENNPLTEDHILIVQQDPSEEDLYRISNALSEALVIGSTFTPPADLQEFYRNAWRGIPQSTPMFTDAHNTSVAALIPLYDESRQVVGVLSIRRDLNEYFESFWEDLLYRILMEVFFFMMWLGMGLWVYSLAKKRVDNLLQGTLAMQNGNYEYRVPVNQTRQDEYLLLANAINSALSKLGERFEMLKFLPRHTQQMIALAAEQQSQIDLNMVRNINCVIMETDIRGFTALSEHLSPQETITLINEYIEVQAEIIIMEEYNGSIDKYMGDAVLVIFEGEEMERRAYECAHHIQYSIRHLNKRKRRHARKNNLDYHDVEIGIGLSTGRVIMGNMGCTQRMEHTVIGSIVNLAARLCSVAKGGEIVIHQKILDKIGKHGLYEEIQVKGFSQPVPVRRLTKAHTTSNLTFCRGITPADLENNQADLDPELDDISPILNVTVPPTE